MYSDPAFFLPKRFLFGENAFCRHGLAVLVLGIGSLHSRSPVPHQRNISVAELCLRLLGELGGACGSDA